ncbi:MAG: 1-deoxy-D-xylulose-5-phosphate reductoisomerase [Planctomycetes bacterium]|nr:1-deoxy-D-xylulose-5-phosphate reductoisomerase [Planctomycetota bacterium]
MKQRRVCILGSTGSIGSQALAVIRELPGLTVCGLSAASRWEILAGQAAEFAPPLAAMTDEQSAGKLAGKLPKGVKLLTGGDCLSELVKLSKPDIVLTAVVGSAGLAPTLAAIEAGARLAVANKETLVMAGEIVMSAARKAGVEVLPVDSEHSAIFQCLQAGKMREVRRVVLTASGGALRDWDDGRAEQATVSEALNHPTWKMGPKITVDSATMMNKALEVVEAHWLFDLSPEQIEVIQHPQSIAHSFVEFCDGSVIAQMGRPDMKGPIAYALFWPDRPPRSVAPLDLAAIANLSFAPLSKRFQRAVNLGYQAVRAGGLAGAAMNAANEAAVQAFLDGKIKFGGIVSAVEAIMGEVRQVPQVNMPALIETDRWARKRVAENSVSAGLTKEHGKYDDGISGYGKHTG